MDIALGKPVISRDGKQVGNVDSLVIDYDTKEVRQILVKQGMLLSTDRIVDRPMIDHVDDEQRVHLNVTAELVEQLPPFVEQEYQIVREEELQHLPHAWVAGGGVWPLYWGAGYPGRGYDPHDSFFQPAPLDPPEVEVESNLREDTIVVNTGTDVVGSDGDKIGTVHEVIYDEDGNVAGFIVQAGVLFHHDIQIRSDWIESVTGDTVRLNMSSDEVESAGRIE